MKSIKTRAQLQRQVRQLEREKEQREADAFYFRDMAHRLRRDRGDEFMTVVIDGVTYRVTVWDEIVPVKQDTAIAHPADQPPMEAYYKRRVTRMRAWCELRQDTEVGEDVQLSIAARILAEDFHRKISQLLK